MPRVNVYLPEEFARDWRAAGVNLSQITQVALRRELARWESERWLRRVAVQRMQDVSHDAVVGVLRAG
ncbi:MAG TPA: type II toxin-antitoxin system CcdA family antitoxin [Acidimicrobiales bacterium]|jgi:post-segregation antitoxin (ccd killing protein)|nr:type II toxin-antitoxin system CcdA family antitoxin [Acidimicrobiales bacterium]